MQASAFEFLCVITFGVFSIAGAGTAALEQGQEQEQEQERKSSSITQRRSAEIEQHFKVSSKFHLK